jgi:hypothetical protein
MRRIVEDYEAKLSSPPGTGSGRGKAEWERYGDGSEELSARFRKLDLPDGATVEVRIDGVAVGQAILSGGSGRLEFESAKGHEVPKAVEGQAVQVIHGGTVILEGVFEPD